MKKALAVLTVLTVFAIGAVAFAHGPDWGGGHMMGPGYGHMNGPGMMGQGYGGCGGPGSCFGGGGVDRKFFEKTADLRRELHGKRFDYMEAVRDPKTDEKTIAKLGKEIDELQEKIYEKAPKGIYGRSGKGHGNRGGYGCR